MNQPHESLDAALRAAAAGRWDALTPDQVDRLECVLNQEPAVAERLAGQKARPEPHLDQVLADLDRRAQPTPRAWQDVWRHIEAAAPRTAGRRPGALSPRVVRLWRPLAAAAACLLLTVFWTLRPSAPEAWPLQLATNVEINELEVSEDATTFVFATGARNDVQVIWVLEDQG